MILSWMDDVDGHWRLKGGAITLAELFYRFGERFTGMELCFWYYHAPKLAKKRAHPMGSKLGRDAAWERQSTFGRWGHRDNWRP